MTIKIIKDNKKVYIIDDENSQDFEYIKFINLLYSGKLIKKFELDDESDEDSISIKKFIEEINKIVQENLIKK